MMNATKEQAMEQDQYTRHGGAYDRGSADAYYARPFIPHMYAGATMMSLRIPQECMSADEIAAYTAGYNETPFGAKYA